MRWSCCAPQAAFGIVFLMRLVEVECSLVADEGGELSVALARLEPRHIGHLRLGASLGASPPFDKLRAFLNDLRERAPALEKAQIAVALVVAQAEIETLWEGMRQRLRIKVVAEPEA